MSVGNEQEYEQKVRDMQTTEAKSTKGVQSGWFEDRRILPSNGTFANRPTPASRHDL